jgi:hypothetical protein
MFAIPRAFFGRSAGGRDVDGDLERLAGGLAGRALVASSTAVDPSAGRPERPDLT